jgi:hypothetical protein
MLRGVVSARRQRLLGVAVVTVAFCAAIAVYVVSLTSSPAAVASASGAAQGSARLTLQTVAAIGPRYPNPDWVSYLARKPNSKWIHSTNLTVPAHSLVRVTIYQYDSSTGLRNPFFARVQGTTGKTMQLDGKTVAAVAPAAPAHTFAVPQLGVFVPLPGVADNAKNQCAEAPCTLSEAHHTITFTFRTGARGRFRWQCFVPCGAGYLNGNGGPMQSFNYMAGWLVVV